MTKRIFRSICLVALIVFLASILLIMGVLYEYFSNVQQAQLRMQTNLAAQGVTNEGIRYFEDLQVNNCRITWIDQDGAVLYDSIWRTDEMENHLEREEITEALQDGYGESRRYSATLMERSLYEAQALADGTVLRLSISQNSVFTLLLGMVQPICIIFAAALLLSILLAMRVSKKIVQPLNEMNLDQPLCNEGYDELFPLFRRMDSQQKQLRRQEAKLLHKQKELHTIMESMNEGMVLLNSKGKILSINSAARGLLDADTDCTGMHLLSLSRNLDLQEILAKALQGEPGKGIFQLHGESYQINASPIRLEGITKGVALFFFNITEKEKAEQLRREFTANVSHELKTPLHAISGYAELMKNNLVKEEDITLFAAQIYEEAQRMVRLVEDIISLSHLDENAKHMPCADIDIYALAEEVLSNLKPEAKAAHVSLELSGEAAVVRGVSQLLYSIVYNLCDNAIKYNQENGHVNVYVYAKTQESTAKGAGVVLKVSDTGIGIAPEHKARIFERFYRVDKSRSKETGGTGLGLSIVKHAAKIHCAEIEVESALGKGTVITIRFPKADNNKEKALSS